MKHTEPVDYLAAIEALRQEEQGQQSQIHDPEYYTPPQTDEPVDYLAASKVWEKEQAGKYKIHLMAGKRNPSHDPSFQEGRK